MAPKILIVDDNPDMREALALAFSPIAEVHEASNGRDAVRLIRTHRPALMLLDVSMPEMSGLDVLAAARAVDPKLAVVMLTGESDLGVAKKALDLGARSFITKPFDVDVVLDELRRLLK